MNDKRFEIKKTDYGAELITKLYGIISDLKK